MKKRSNYWPSFWRLLITIALQNVIVYGVNLADNIMLGRYSEPALSAVALVNQVQFLLQMVVSGMSDGTVVMSSRFWGEKNIQDIKKTTSVGLLFGLGFAAILFIFAFFFPSAVLSIFTDKQEFIDEGISYIKIVAFSYFFFAITQALLGMLRSVETASIGFTSSVISLVFNIFLNYALIFGHFGMPRLGVTGAAIATLIARIVETLVVAVYAFAIDKKLKTKPSELFTLDYDILKKFIRVSLPVMLSGGSWGIAMGVQTAILGRLEASVVSANSIATTVFSIMTVFIYGSSSATQIMIGKTIGETGVPDENGHVMSAEERLDVVKHYSRRSQFVFLILGLCTGVGLFVMKNIIVGFYDVSAETAAMALAFMTVLSVTCVGTAYQVPCLGGLVRGGGDTKFVLYNDIIFQWLIIIPISCLSAFVFNLPAVVTFCCLKSDQILKCFVAVVKVNRFKWVKKI